MFLHIYRRPREQRPASPWGEVFHRARAMVEKGRFCCSNNKGVLSLQPQSELEFWLLSDLVIDSSIT